MAKIGESCPFLEDLDVSGSFGITTQGDKNNPHKRQKMYMHLVKLSFGQLVIWSTGYLVNWLFGQLVIWSTGLLVNCSFGQIVIWSNCHLVQL
jgi:hypothetical protein